MKRAYVLLLAFLLILTGCSGKEKINNVSIKDVCCPYEINHKKNVVDVTLQDSEQSGIVWNVDAVPEDICQVTQKNINKEHTVQYSISGKEEGAAKLTFTATMPNEKACFVLDLVVNVNSQGKAVVSSYKHYEIKDNTIDANGLKYKWNVDVNGILNFSFISQEDTWNVRGEESEAFVLSNMISTPVGCKFSAKSIAMGKTTVVLTGENSQRTIHVVIQADDQGKTEVISVQEQ